MEGRVKIALYALNEMHKASSSWLKLAGDSCFTKKRGFALRMALRRKAEGIVFHDRILNGRKIGGEHGRVTETV